MPFVEQTALYNDWVSESAKNVNGLNFSGRNTAVPAFLCPSDPAGAKASANGISGNYLLSGGGRAWGNQNTATDSTGGEPTGVFYPQSRVRLGDIVDGTSTTLISSEIILVPDGPAVVAGCSGGTRDSAVGCTGTMSTWARCSCPCVRRTPCLLTWSDGRASITFVPCNSCSYSNGVVTPRSYHPGGVNAGLADGSVQFVADGVETAVFQSLGNPERRGGCARILMPPPPQPECGRVCPKPARAGLGQTGLHGPFYHAEHSESYQTSPGGHVGTKSLFRHRLPQTSLFPLRGSSRPSPKPTPMRFSVLLVVTGVRPIATGCGTRSVSVEGTVAFKGTPVAEGTITLEPVAKEAGAVVESPIREGAYRAVAKPGKYRVVFSAYQTSKTPGPDGQPHKIQYLPAKFTVASGNHRRGVTRRQCQVQLRPPIDIMLTNARSSPAPANCRWITGTS